MLGPPRAGKDAGQNARPPVALLTVGGHHMALAPALPALTGSLRSDHAGRNVGSRLGAGLRRGDLDPHQLQGAF